MAEEIMIRMCYK